MHTPRSRGSRRSKLIVPADRWDMIVKSNNSGADIIHLDLEDGVLPANKPHARDNVRRALAELDWERQEVWVRIDHVDAEDTRETLAAATAGSPNLIYMAKATGPDDMRRLGDAVADAAGGAHAIELGAVIERIRALDTVEAIAAAPGMGAIVFGVADMANEFGYRQSRLPGQDYETLYIRSRMILAARLAGIDVIDAPFPLFREVEASEQDAEFSARLGFTGKSAITPRQIAGIHRAFAPSENDLAWARQVVAFKEASATTGAAIGVVDGEMVDKPHIEKAERILARQP